MVRAKGDAPPTLCSVNFPLDGEIELEFRTKQRKISLRLAYLETLPGNSVPFRSFHILVFILFLFHYVKVFSLEEGEYTRSGAQIILRKGENPPSR